MGDTPEGSSTAAQRAQVETPEPPQVASSGAADIDTTDATPGFFGRIVQALTPTDPDPEPEEQETTRATAMPPGMVNLRRMRVEDVMLPKADVIAVPDTITQAELVDVFREHKLTRLPVFAGTLDTPLGFVHLKDFVLAHGFNGSGEADFSIAPLVRPLLYVPPSMPLGVLLTKMQADRVHIALVIDEYGGADGLLTIEDVIEQVIGEIEDEHDTVEGRYWSEEKPGCYLAQAKTPLDEFEAEIGFDLTAHDEIDEEDIETLGGLVFMLSGRVPVRGEVVPHPAGPEFEIVDADPRRIKRLRVHVPAHARTAG
ncbi:MAG: hemolysin family protein [Pseudomonadota bacterium]